MGDSTPFSLIEAARSASGFVVEGLARLIFARLQEGDRQGAGVFLGDGLALHRGGFIADQGREAAAQVRADDPVRRVHAAALIRSRWISSPASLM